MAEEVDLDLEEMIQQYQYNNPRQFLLYPFLYAIE
jgi:hypothetical protein